MFFKPSELYIEFVKWCKERPKRCPLRHLRKGIDVLREALPAVAKLAVWSWNKSMSIVDVAGEQHARMDSNPIRTHLLAIVVDGVEVGDFVRSENVVALLGYFRLKR